jgi:tripartite-type tricarboxylate transporter receptor subunit TctC
VDEAREDRRHQGRIARQVIIGGSTKLQRGENMFQAQPNSKSILQCAGTTAIAALLLGALPVAAQDYPAKTVRMIIPFPPGGSNDIVGRMIAQQLTERLGKQFIVDNRGGAGGTIGTELAAKSPPDGHTLLIISVAYAFNTAMYNKLPYDPVKSFIPVAMLGTGPNALAVHPSLPAKTVKEFIAFAKSKPGELNYASAGIGSFQHLGSELFRIMSGINVVHVPFKGGGPAMIDVISGQSQFCTGSLLQLIPFHRSGKLKLLGTGGAKRVAAMPEVPTISEAGLKGYEANNWWGILTPTGTSDAIVKKLNGELSVILKSPETQKRFSSEGAESLQMSPDQFTKYIASETAKWARVVKEAGIKAE